MRFRAEQHLRRQLDFQHVRTHGRRHDCGAFTLWYARHAAPAVAPSKTEIPVDPAAVIDIPPAIAPAEKKIAPARIGVVASRAAVGNAVQRARAKRRLREAFRHQQLRVPSGYDLLLVARGSLNRLEYHEIERRFVDACRKVFPSVQA
jgi:ribonuclease P protein component